MNRRYRFLAVLGLLLGATLPLFAHHAIGSEFNPLKEWSISGVLSEVKWTNPHLSTWVQATDPVTGKVENYGCEGNGPAVYHRLGLNKADWKIGEPVVMTCNAAKDGDPHWGFLKMLKYKSDGHVMVFRLGGE